MSFSSRFCCCAAWILNCGPDTLADARLPTLALGADAPPPLGFTLRIPFKFAAPKAAAAAAWIKGHAPPVATTAPALEELLANADAIPL